jgi:diaminopimelate epimerase
LASGTGSSAAALAAMINGLVERSVTVTLPGGALKIQWDESTDHVFMTGSARYSFSGELDPHLLDDLE